MPRRQHRSVIGRRCCTLIVLNVIAGLVAGGVFHTQYHIGDRFTDADMDGAAEWEVVSRPVTFKKGHEVRARVQRPGNPATAREKYWAAHEKVTVRRMTAPPPRPTAEAETIGDMKAILGTRRSPLASAGGSCRPPLPGTAATAVSCLS